MDRRERLQVTGALRAVRARAYAPSAPSRLQGKLVHTCERQTGRLAPWTRIPPDTCAMAMHLRDFRDADRATLSALWDACALTRPWNDPNADIDRAVTSRDAAMLVGTWNETVVASIMVGHDGHRGWIYYLAVGPDHRARGHGREMMAEAELWLQARGVPKAQLMVREGNEAATNFYSALGYERQDVTVFGKWLASSSETD